MVIYFYYHFKIKRNIHLNLLPWQVTFPFFLIYACSHISNGSKINRRRRWVGRYIILGGIVLLCFNLDISLSFIPERIWVLNLPENTFITLDLVINPTGAGMGLMVLKTCRQLPPGLFLQFATQHMIQLLGYQQQLNNIVIDDGNPVHQNLREVRRGKVGAALLIQEGIRQTILKRIEGD